MRHWHTSAALGFILTGRFRPVCSIIYELPDCRARRAFIAEMDRRFHETDHARRIALTYRIGRHFRRWPND